MASSNQGSPGSGDGGVSDTGRYVDLSLLPAQQYDRNGKFYDVFICFHDNHVVSSVRLSLRTVAQKIKRLIDDRTSGRASVFVDEESISPSNPLNATISHAIHHMNGGIAIVLITEEMLRDVESGKWARTEMRAFLELCNSDGDKGIKFLPVAVDIGFSAMEKLIRDRLGTALSPTSMKGIRLPFDNGGFSTRVVKEIAESAVNALGTGHPWGSSYQIAYANLWNAIVSSDLNVSTFAMFLDVTGVFKTLEEVLRAAASKEFDGKLQLETLVSVFSHMQNAQLRSLAMAIKRKYLTQYPVFDVDLFRPTVTNIVSESTREVANKSDMGADETKGASGAKGPNRDNRKVEDLPPKERYDLGTNLVGMGSQQMWGTVAILGLNQQLIIGGTHPGASLHDFAHEVLLRCLHRKVYEVYDAMEKAKRG